MIGIALAVVAVGIATAGLLWTWLFRNFAIVTANWLDDLVEYLSADDNKYRYEVNDITECLLPKIDCVELDCMKRFIRFAIVWALTVTHMLMSFAGIIDPYISVVAIVGVVHISYVMYTDYYKYLYLKTEMVKHQLTFNKKAEDDDYADA